MERYGSELLSTSIEPFTPDSGDHIPHDFLSDVLEGLRDPVSLRHWDSHLAECDLCQANRRAFASDGVRVDPIVLAKRVAHTSTSGSLGKIRGWLRQGVSEFGPRYRIAAGESNCDVYDQPTANTIADVLTKARKLSPTNAGMQLVTGPILSIREGSGPRRNRTVISDLVKHPSFDLYYSRYRQRLHFRGSSPEQRLYCESEHSVASGEREPLFVIDGNMTVVSLFAHRFDRLRTDHLVEHCTDKTTDRFAFMTNAELMRLYQEVARRHVEEGGLPYGDMLDVELLSVADDLGIAYDGDVE